MADAALRRHAVNIDSVCCKCTVACKHTHSMIRKSLHYSTPDSHYRAEKL
jgi:hypothetical protein